jgi:hypothetical protein
MIKWIFGVLKRCFRILVYPPEIDMDYQACLPAALAAIHNFICIHGPDELSNFEKVEDLQPGMQGNLATGEARRAERVQTDMRCDNIANAMWAQYQGEVQQQGCSSFCILAM